MQGPLSAGASEMRGRGWLAALWEVAAHEASSELAGGGLPGAFTGWKCLQNRPTSPLTEESTAALLLFPAIVWKCASLFRSFFVRPDTSEGHGTSNYLHGWLMVIKCHCCDLGSFVFYPSLFWLLNRRSKQLNFNSFNLIVKAQTKPEITSTLLIVMRRNESQYPYWSMKGNKISSWHLIFFHCAVILSPCHFTFLCAQCIEMIQKNPLVYVTRES